MSLLRLDEIMRDHGVEELVFQLYPMLSQNCNNRFQIMPDDGF